MWEYRALEQEGSEIACGQGHRIASRCQAVFSIEYHTYETPCCSFLLFVGLVPSLASAQRITVKGNRFEVDGKEIWISGANTPWKTWNEFGNKFRRRLVAGTLPRIEGGRR